jgi:hypothetical protein
MTPLDNSPCTRVPFTYLESLLSVWCDPCPPWSQVACKLTSPSPFPPQRFPNSIMRPSTTTSRHRLHLVQHTYLVSFLFVLAHPAACYLFQWFIFHTCTLPEKPDATIIHTSKQYWCITSHVKRTYLYISHNHHYTIFLLILLLHFWAGQLAPNFHGGSTNKTDSILVNGHNITDKSTMANDFNNFFTYAGTRLSDTVNPTSLDPRKFIPPNPNPPQL